MSYNLTSFSIKDKKVNFIIKSIINMLTIVVSAAYEEIDEFKGEERNDKSYLDQWLITFENIVLENLEDKKIDELIKNYILYKDEHLLNEGDLSIQYKIENLLCDVIDEASIEIRLLRDEYKKFLGEDYEKKLKQIEHDFNELSNCNTLLKSEMDDLYKLKNSLLEEKNNLIECNKSLEIELAEEKFKVTNLKKEITEIKSNIVNENNVQKNNKLEIKLKTLQEEVNVNKGFVASLKNKLDVAKTENMHLKTEDEKQKKLLKEIRVDYEKEIRELKEQMSYLNEKLKDEQSKQIEFMKDMEKISKHKIDFNELKKEYSKFVKKDMHRELEKIVKVKLLGEMNTMEIAMEMIKEARKLEKYISKDEIQLFKKGCEKLSSNLAEIDRKLNEEGLNNTINNVIEGLSKFINV